MRSIYLSFAFFIGLIGVVACAAETDAAISSVPSSSSSAPVPADAASLVVAGGCFWCVESDFEKQPGVYEAVSGYGGGQKRDATYRDHKGHREVVEIFYDRAVTDYATLVRTFLRSIDVTDAGGQFCDRGYAYTTAIHYRTDAEKSAAEAALAEAAAYLGETPVTPVEPIEFVVVAEDYHQDYYKSQDRIASRFGIVTKAEAYKGYRRGCGRDARVKAVWGDQAISH